MSLRRRLKMPFNWNLKKIKTQKWPTPPHPTLDILTECWPNVLALVKVSKNTQMHFQYHTESISQHVDHFKPIKNFLKKNVAHHHPFHLGFTMSLFPIVLMHSQFLSVLYQPVKVFIGSFSFWFFSPLLLTVT